MPVQVHSARPLGPIVVPAAATPLGQVSAGKVWRINGIAVCNSGGVLQVVTLQVVSVVSGSGTFFRATVGANTSVIFSGTTHVFHELDGIVGFSSVGGTAIEVSMHGSILEGVPPAP